VSFARTLALLPVLAGAGCVQTYRPEIPVGYACHRQFHYDESPRRYSCLFELSAPSTYYDDGTIHATLDRFMRDEGGACAVVGDERDVADVRTQQMDHGLRYRLFTVECRR
jgi:hypothetical protein